MFDHCGAIKKNQIMKSAFKGKVVGYKIACVERTAYSVRIIYQNRIFFFFFFF